MKKSLIFVVVLLAWFSGGKASSQDLTQYVDPFIGTGAHGHTFPGPCLPHGMVQVSPDTGEDGWDWCSGYHDSDTSLMGFSLTHLSGTGAADLGDILFMAYTGGWKTEPGSKEHPGEGYRSIFSHQDEQASAGYYSVMLKSYGIKAELTATARCALQRYTYPKTGDRDMIIDLGRGIQNKTVSSSIRFVGDDAVEGYRQSTGWAHDRYVYFYAKFNQPIEKKAIDNDGQIEEDKAAGTGKIEKALIRFSGTTGQPVLVKVSISAVSIANAKANLESGLPGWDFSAVRASAEKSWNKLLSKIEVEGGSTAEKRTFYTAVYHSLLAPYLYSDVNGQYVGMDRKVHQAQGFNYYTVFSLWDTFRAAHPLYSLIEPKTNDDFVKSMLAMYKEGGRLPVWELDSNETWCMIGNHSIPVIAEACLHGHPDFNIAEAYQAMKATVEDTIRGMKAYHQYGYVPDNVENNSVSITVEYAYDDWCVAQVARKLGKMADYRKYMQRAENYKNLYNPATRFLQGKDTQGQWREPFNPIDVSRLGSDDFTEGNSWQYTFFAPQDVDGLVHLIGGKKAFAHKLDSLFDQPSINNNPGEPDVSGMIGQYAQGNEPSHEIAYLYDYVGEPYKTADRVREIMDSLYTDTRSGLCGNDDCGQMSAWYVFGAMGFYPVNPSSGEYAIGSPVFSKITLHTGSGHPFEVEAKDVSKANKYIQSATLNGKDYPYSYITRKTIEQGGRLIFRMGDKPSSWATQLKDCPVSRITY
ncbi:GH92 family glycosyl hydrolase [Microbacter margulisiae]|uniref:Putative alpha-1,2-mannosidase n=1 Tax=Microbacter margulisiae TaxID=1350067 RepID=A0A7W5H1M6_9PORP|nr:GH92 family glycosyl hydrolase [Microbacter margulisiae]MBB3186527.1 putative alpha-1,2-mannosidase [Microbacter margulisiae]